MAFAAFNFFGVKKMPEGTDQMSEIASAIRVGANAFIEYEYKILYLVIAIVAVLLAIVTMWQAAVALVLGSIMSGCAGYIGMKIATYANVRVSNKARETHDIGQTVKVAFRGGSVMGWVFSPRSSGQANRRSRRAEAISEALKAKGYNAGMYYAMD